jgi:predicted HD phosphohydrolase
MSQSLPNTAPAELHASTEPANEKLARFTRMDQSTHEDWMKIGAATLELQPTVPARVLGMLRALGDLHAGFGVSQLHHALQTATMAKRANAADDMILCALCHDIGKYVSIANHGSIAAEMLRPYVSDAAYKIVLTHQDFQGRHYYGHFGKSTELRERYRSETWFAQAEQFTDEWDQAAFDPAYKVLPLEEFQPLIEQRMGVFPFNF